MAAGRSWGTEGLVVSPKGFTTLTHGSPEPRAMQAAVPEWSRPTSLQAHFCSSGKSLWLAMVPRVRPGTPGLPALGSLPDYSHCLEESSPDTPRLSPLWSFPQRGFLSTASLRLTQPQARPCPQAACAPHARVCPFSSALLSS